MYLSQLTGELSNDYDMIVCMHVHEPCMSTFSIKVRYINEIKSILPEDVNYFTDNTETATVYIGTWQLERTSCYGSYQLDELFSKTLCS